MCTNIKHATRKNRTKHFTLSVTRKLWGVCVSELHHRHQQHHRRKEAK